MQTENLFITTPVGRIVSGDVYNGRNTDGEGNPLVYKSGARKGEPRTEWSIGLAIPKAGEQHWNQTQWGATIWNAAQSLRPNYFNAGQCVHPQFAFKIMDGDSQQPNTKGKKPCDNPNYVGHWILWFSNGSAPSLYDCIGGKAPEPLAAEIKIMRGYYVQVQGSIASNGSDQSPGIFLNLNMVALCGYGEVIQSGPDVSQAGFGGQALPAGASATPLAGQMPSPAPATTPTPSAPAQMPAPSTAPAAQPSAIGGSGQVQAAPAATVQPAQDFLNPGQPIAGASPAPAAQMAPPSPVEEKYDLNGVQYTKAQLVASGWNDAQIAALPKV